jgi:hypothetical protein
MSLYDDVVTDFGKTNNGSNSNKNTNNTSSSSDQKSNDIGNNP